MKIISRLLGFDVKNDKSRDILGDEIRDIERKDPIRTKPHRVISSVGDTLSV